MYMINMRPPATSSGFALTEVLIYIAILVLFSVGAISLLLTLSDVLATQKADRLVIEVMNTTVERMLLEIRQAGEVDLAASTLEDANGVLVLKKGTDTTTISLAAGTVQLSKNGTVLGTLTPKEVTTEQLRFFHYDNGSTETVRIVLKISSLYQSNVELLESAAILHASYD